MLNECSFEGVRYILIHDNWVDKDGVMVSSSLENKLYKKLLDDEGLCCMPYKVLSRKFDVARADENISLAKRIGQVVIDRAELPKDYFEIRWILPKVTSLLRKCNNSEEAINIADKLLETYGTVVESEALYTSLAASCLDLWEIDHSKEYFSKAKGILIKKEGIGLPVPFLLFASVLFLAEQKIFFPSSLQ